MTCNQCDQIGQFIGLWTSFESLWQQLICQNLPHSKVIFVNVKIYHFSCEINLRQLLYTFSDFFLVTLLATSNQSVPFQHC